jgi:hypothetical protein
VEIGQRAQIEGSAAWARALAGQRKDRRYYELVEDTIHQGFEYRYFILSDAAGEVRAIQPFFIADQDLLAGMGSRTGRAAGAIRRVWPRFMRMRTLMIGCAAGEGHLDAEDRETRSILVHSLAGAISRCARELRTGLAVFKEFTAADRGVLAQLKEYGFTRVPSMPMTRLKLDFASFEDYLHNVLSRNMRSKLRRNLKKSEGNVLELRIVTDISPYIDEIYPLYLAVYERSGLHFEKLTPEYFCRIGQAMPEKTVYFMLLYENKIVAFNLCLLHNDEICSEYVGFDYSVAFDLHLYYVIVRRVMEWALANGYRWYCSTSLNYEPKYHLKHALDPLDLYVRHESPTANFLIKWALRYLEPTRHDAMLKRFRNYRDLYAD